MVNKENIKFLKDALNQLEIAYRELQDFVYHTDSETCSDIETNIYLQIIYLKELINDLDF